MMYRILKLVIQVALKVFFRRMQVKNRELAPVQGPLLVVANHPNTFMDPLLIAAALKQEVSFLTKGSIFNTPLKKWLLQRMHMIPVYRREDSPADTAQNQQTFRKSFEFLERRGTLLIFPEGNSINERRLRPLKTGAARIALGAEERNSFGLGLTILPVGLNYSDPTRFRSEVFVNMGEPVVVAHYAEQYRQDPVQAVQQLTQDLRVRLEELIIVTDSEEEDELVRSVEEVFKSRLLPKEKPVKEQEHQLTRNIIRSMRYFQEREPERLQALKEQLRSFRRNTERLRLRDNLFQPKPAQRKFWRHLLGTMLFLLLGLPVYLYGLLNNYLPYIIPAKAADALTADEEYRAPVMMTVGIFSFSLLYLLQTGLCWYFTGSWGWALLYLLSLPPSGFFALQYWQKLETSVQDLRLLLLFYRRSSLVSTLLVQRREIIKALEAAKADYLRELNRAEN